MTGDLTPRSEYTPTRRVSSSLSPVRQIMNIRTEALIDRARITAEISNVGHEAKERTAEAYDLAEYVTERAGRLTRKIQEEGNDPELHQMHSYIKGGAATAIVDLMQGLPHEGESA
jgi:hypothetical protein